MAQYLWDENKVRYQLKNTSTSSSKSFNWLFFPGGPGIDSSYYETLTPHLNLPGNIWYIDFPNNGSNIIPNTDRKNFESWLTVFLSIVQRFENPIFVGHSFSGMFPLLFPELENYIKGVVLIGGAPTLWFDASARMGKELGLPDLTPYMTEYMQNPNEETFTKINLVVANYYFTYDVLQQGITLLKATSANPYGPHWWMPKVQQINYSAKWIPQHTPALIMGGAKDATVPFSLFLEDLRFKRDNILLKVIPDTAHFCWFGSGLQPVKNAFNEFINRLLA